jgi:hypothetical protein
MAMVGVVECLIFASMMFILLLPRSEDGADEADGRQRPVRAAGGIGPRPLLDALTGLDALARAQDCFLPARFGRSRRKRFSS